MIDRHQINQWKGSNAADTAVFYYITGARGSEDVRSQTNTIKRYLYRQKHKRATRFSDRQALDAQDIRLPGLVSLLLAAQEAKKSNVAVEHVSRFSTDRVTCAVVLSLLEQMGSQVIDLSVVAEKAEQSRAPATDAYAGEFETTVQNRVKAWRTYLRLRAGRLRKRAATGRCEGGKRFGTLSGERKTLRRIMELARKPRKEKGRSSQEIAEILNAEGLRTRFQRYWTRWNVYNLLQKMRYSRQRRKKS